MVTQLEALEAQKLDETKGRFAARKVVASLGLGMTEAVVAIPAALI